MRVAVVCRDALLRDGILSLLAHEGAFEVTGGSEHVVGVTRGFMEGESSILVAAADMLDTDDWVQLNQMKASGAVSIILLVSSATSTVGQRVADAVVRRSEGSAALIQAVRRFIGPSMYRPYSDPVGQYQQPVQPGYQQPVQPGYQQPVQQGYQPYGQPPVQMQPAAPAPQNIHEPLSIYGAPRSLTKRELEVAQLVAQGMPNRRIAAVLQLQEQSIKNLVSAVMRKLDCENRVQVALRLSGRPSTSARRTY